MVVIPYVPLSGTPASPRCQWIGRATTVNRSRGERIHFYRGWIDPAQRDLIVGEDAAERVSQNLIARRTTGAEVAMKTPERPQLGHQFVLGRPEGRQHGFAGATGNGAPGKGGPDLDRIHHSAGAICNRSYNLARLLG
jgi:hypothetical protein